MEKKISVAEIKNTLNDERFILWCLNPSKELDEQLHTWLEKNPDQAAHIEQTRRIVSSVRLNEYKMPDDERQQLQARILHDIRKK